MKDLKRLLIRSVESVFTSIKHLMNSKKIAVKTTKKLKISTNKEHMEMNHFK